MFEVNQAFRVSCGLRPIKAFDPAILLEVDPKSMRLFLTSDAKLIWFYQYCLENNIAGAVESHFDKCEELKSIPSSQYEGGEGTVFKEYWTATVFMNGEPVTHATSSETFVVNNPVERDEVSGSLRKLSIGAALSQAGFGVLSGIDMSENDKSAWLTNQPAPAAPNNGADNTPFTTTPQSAPTQQAADPFFGNQTQMQFSAPAQETTPPAAAPVMPSGTAVSPLDAAKAMVWQGGGPMKGMTLGTILGEPNGIMNIKWIATMYAPHSDAGKAIKAAAQTILNAQPPVA